MPFCPFSRVVLLVGTAERARVEERKRERERERERLRDHPSRIPPLFRSLATAAAAAVSRLTPSLDSLFSTGLPQPGPRVVKFNPPRTFQQTCLEEGKLGVAGGNIGQHQQLLCQTPQQTVILVLNYSRHNLRKYNTF